MSQSFTSKVAVLNHRGDHVRHVPAALASALIAAGTVVAHPTRGRIRAVTLVRSAATHAVRIGDPTGTATGVRFYRWAHLPESGSRIVEHHPRCTYD